MCNYDAQEQAMVEVRPGVHCDPCLVPLVRALYENGFPTVASCCGHGEQPANLALADGRQVFVADSEWAEEIWGAIMEKRDGQPERTGKLPLEHPLVRAEAAEERAEAAEARADRYLQLAAREATRARRSGESDGELNRAATGAAAREAERGEKAEAKVKEVEGERDEARSSAEHHRANAQRYRGVLREIGDCSTPAGDAVHSVHRMRNLAIAALLDLDNEGAPDAQ